ncbi:MAG TPA: hypothetical protein VN903_11240 [Polyangia bacterium]|nr:hypothetical protein [Polyangia bacterium]
MTWAAAAALLIVASCKRQQPDVVIVQIPIPAAAFAVADAAAEYRAQAAAKTNLAEKAEDDATERFLSGRNVRFQDVAVATGDLPAKTIKDTMTTHYRKLVPCMFVERNAGAQVSELAVDFVVRPSGKVTAVKVNGQKTGRLSDCILGRMPEFPPFSGEKTVASWALDVGH